MDFGMPTLIENQNIDENIDLCKRLNLKFIELNMNLPEYQIEELENISKYRSLVENSGIYFTIHLDENLNVADFNHAVSQAYADTVKRTIIVAKELEVPILNMHMNHGVHFTLPEGKVQLFEKYYGYYEEKYRQFVRMCEETVGDSGVKICVENTDGFREYERQMIEEMLESPVFALTWDIGHSNSAGNVDEAFMLQHENRLAHFHIHDSVGKKDHMTLGTGEIDLLGRLQIARRNHCRCVVETKTVAALEQSVKWLQEDL